MENVSAMPFAERRIGVVPARLELHERDGVRPVAVHLVGRHVDERRLGTVPPRRLEQVQRADGVGVEVVERNRGRADRATAARRCGRWRRAQLRTSSSTPSVADVQLVMTEVGQRFCSRADSSGYRPAGRRRRRAGYCPGHGSNPGGETHTSEPISPDEPVTRMIS